MLCDGRHRLRLRRSVRPARARRRAHGVGARGLDRADDHRRCAQDLNAGGSKFCGDCPLKLPLEEGRGAAGRGRSTPAPLPVAACTSSARRPATSRAPRRAARRKPASRGRGRPACSTSTCSAASSTRSGPSLGRIDFFNYGEAFLHKRAVEMCEYIKTHFPHIYLYTSTNGLALTEAQARRLVHSGIDEVTFSIDGATQESYVQVPAARAASTSRSPTCARWPTRSGGRAATCRS